MKFVFVKWLALVLALVIRGTIARPNLLFMMADQMRFDTVGPHPDAPSHRSFTPNIDSMLHAEGVKFTNAYSSTPTCTPARAALLTGQSPWNHGMLGYGVVADRYPCELPRVMAEAGYKTVSIGKDHFGWNKTANHGIRHGYQQTQLYDGIVSEGDDYHQWFARQMPGVAPESGWPTLDMNSWRGAPYVYNESYHPTAWVGTRAVEVIRAHARSGASRPPLFLKVSLCHGLPYDPPKLTLTLFVSSF